MSGRLFPWQGAAWVGTGQGSSSPDQVRTENCSHDGQCNQPPTPTQAAAMDGNSGRGQVLFPRGTREPPPKPYHTDSCSEYPVLGATSNRISGYRWAAELLQHVIAAGT